MSEKYPPIVRGFPHFLHGGDYNPDQWQHLPAVIDRDFELMAEAGCNTFSVGIFAWTALEPADGRYTFDWLDRIMDRLAEAGHHAVLATPSGAKPAWLAKQHPEVRRVTADGRREPYRARHNHCPTSPVYRRKVAEINDRLAERYADHPALAMWHVSNEYSGECYCELCLEAFRRWLEARYGSLDELNRAWWSAFWSHQFTAWDEIDPRDGALDAAPLDWRRFVSDQTLDFMNHEIAAVRRHSDAPATINMMGPFPTLDYHKFAAHLDVVSNDWYPKYHARPEMWRKASGQSWTHDLMRGLKGGRPWVLMESTPSIATWGQREKLKRPNQHRLESMQAVAHGSDSVMYFQWRKGRGGWEKIHGVVVDHVNHGMTRVFREVSEVGSVLGRLDAVVGTPVPAEVAIVHDWECRWALESSAWRMIGDNPSYVGASEEHYRPFWRRGVPVDVVGHDAPFDRYRLLIAPLLYMLRPGFVQQVQRFVESGGTFVTTYLSGHVNETNLMFMGGLPGDGLGELLGLWSEELDLLYDDDRQAIAISADNALGLSGRYDSGMYCDRVHTQGCDVLATYTDQFYAGEPAVTVNHVGKGEAYYLASGGDELRDAFHAALCDRLGIRPVLDGDWPEGVTVQRRTDGEQDYLFVLNFHNKPRTMFVRESGLEDMLEGGPVGGETELEPFASRVWRRPARP